MNTLREKYKIRPADIGDVPEIYVLIKELAEYERLINEVVVTKEMLEETLFGDNSNVKVLIAYNGSQVLGFALYFHTYSTLMGRPGIYLEDLFVREFARGYGIGEGFMRRLAKFALEMGGGRLEWSVLDWNESAIRFYNRMGAVPLEEWTTFRLTGKKLKKLALL